MPSTTVIVTVPTLRWGRLGGEAEAWAGRADGGKRKLEDRRSDMRGAGVFGFH